MNILLLRILLFNLSNGIFQFLNKTLSIHSMNLNNKEKYKLFNALLKKL